VLQPLAALAAGALEGQVRFTTPPRGPIPKVDIPPAARPRASRGTDEAAPTLTRPPSPQAFESARANLQKLLGLCAGEGAAGLAAAAGAAAQAATRAVASDALLEKFRRLFAEAQVNLTSI